MLGKGKETVSSIESTEKANKNVFFCCGISPKKKKNQLSEGVSREEMDTNPSGNINN